MLYVVLRTGFPFLLLLNRPQVVRKLLAPSRVVAQSSVTGVASDGKRFKKQIQILNETQASPFGWLALPTRRPRLSRLEIFLSFLK